MQSTPPTPDPPLKVERARGLGPATPVAFVATALPILGSLGMLSVGPFIAHWLRDQGIIGAIWFVVAFALLGALTIAPTYTTSIIAGWTFGFALGFPVVILGTVIGATLCYVIARRFAHARVQSTFQQRPKWDLVRRALMEDNPIKTFFIVVLLRFSPVLPFGTTNVLLSTTGVRLPIYIFGTVLGLMPRLGLIVLAAAGAEKLDFSVKESWWMLLAGIVATGLLIVTLAMVGKRALEWVTREQTSANSPGLVPSK